MAVLCVLLAAASTAAVLAAAISDGGGGGGGKAERCAAHLSAVCLKNAGRCSAVAACKLAEQRGPVQFAVIDASWWPIRCSTGAELH